MSESKSVRSPLSMYDELHDECCLLWIDLELSANDKAPHEVVLTEGVIDDLRDKPVVKREFSRTFETVAEAVTWMERELGEWRLRNADGKAGQ